MDTRAGPAARPHGGDRAPGLHRGGEAADRAALSRAAPARGERPHRRALSVITDEALRRHHPRLHARGRRAQSRARDRRRLPPRRRCASPRARPARRSRSRPDDLPGSPGPARASRTRWRCAPACPASRPGSPGRRSGGDILFIEATRMPGNGRLILTGQLGDVMKESAQAALSLVKSRARGARHRRGALRQERHPHPRAGGRHPEGRARAPASP